MQLAKEETTEITTQGKKTTIGFSNLKEKQKITLDQLASFEVSLENLSSLNKEASVIKIEDALEKDIRKVSLEFNRIMQISIALWRDLTFQNYKTLFPHLNFKDVMAIASSKEGFLFEPKKLNLIDQEVIFSLIDNFLIIKNGSTNRYHLTEAGQREIKYIRSRG